MLLSLPTCISSTHNNFHHIKLLISRLIDIRSLIQSNLSIPDTLGPNKTVLIIEVSLFQRFNNTH